MLSIAGISRSLELMLFVRDQETFYFTDSLTTMKPTGCLDRAYYSNTAMGGIY